MSELVKVGKPTYHRKRKYFTLPATGKKIHEVNLDYVTYPLIPIKEASNDQTYKHRGQIMTHADKPIIVDEGDLWPTPHPDRRSLDILRAEIDYMLYRLRTLGEEKDRVAAYRERIEVQLSALAKDKSQH